MKVSLGRMPLGVKFAFILLVSLLIPGVIPKSLGSSVETSTSATTSSKEDYLDKETVLEKPELESNEPETDSNEVDLTARDDSLDHDETTTLDKEPTNSPQEDAKMTKEESSSNLEEFLMDNVTEANTAEGEYLNDLDDDDVDEELAADAAELMNFIVKRAAEEDDKAGNPQTGPINVDEFSFSDLPKLLGPLVKAFSGSPESEPPPDEFFSWFPALKKLLDAYMDQANEATSTDLPTSSVLQPARRSGFPTSPEPALQIVPASTQQAESEVLPSPSFLAELVPPAISEPPPASQPSLSDIPDSEEMFY
ncbi:uncharacterized protein LOC128346888 isoform X2 [Hemicordylus capensis]|uniref:uncharacterized protein LOC128346888 isoform X2 n=1 Tax=Hemicordylus capensis TaxID=884348 RepID=UPI0023028623|nr:uncharacterized protein LOC128346888 isoform X2 [Hemicordylus capensis]XP_053156626.1 uncharacterized protein LOC128346888 isoform X2 [Hemicordylus capensis]XP_053156627.1 uncharacterized protein LOC128346888 isoform X2 [Hemicordylus capensis]XP_053156628.1 uncharacterized protein LOC128346888 isoform X2 [Hemicordylus capensis]XP_053156629.1 uncharacterized protein LOC128346888 isoform X2 [Hemicordylus capensis]XP_053156630.1 uncharacterized protein LOC128346888 isoform X2 [Hemicordylus cap